jgi:hypothetical protein
MTTRLKYGRAGALAVIGGALCLLAAASPAKAQCVGDCNGDGMVSINELILGVNIALGLQPVTACPAFQNAQGMVDIAQLIKGVNNALNGCPATPTVTPSGTPAGTASATVTATATNPPPANTPTATPSPTGAPVTPPIGSQTCAFVKTCSGGDHHDCTKDADCMPDAGTCNGNTKSGVALYAGAFPVPLNFGLGGSAKIDCGTPDANGKTQCTCGIISADPISIPSIGFVCIQPAPTPCPSSTIYCNGGDPVGLTALSDGNIGACTGNDACNTACDTYCAGISSVRVNAGCTGFCTAGSMKACNLDADCLPNDGSCNGPDPVGANGGICQCSCVNTAAGNASRPGDFECNLGASLAVEAHAPCDGTDVTINVGTACIPLSTGAVSTFITHANFSAGATVPSSGQPVMTSGQPATCEQMTAGNLSSIQIHGAVNFFGSALGDLATSLSTYCK